LFSYQESFGFHRTQRGVTRTYDAIQDLFNPVHIFTACFSKLYFNVAYLKLTGLL